MGIEKPTTPTTLSVLFIGIFVSRGPANLAEKFTGAAVTAILWAHRKASASPGRNLRLIVGPL
jgi:hypothetical protein